MASSPILGTQPAVKRLVGFVLLISCTTRRGGVCVHRAVPAAPRPPHFKATPTASGSTSSSASPTAPTPTEATAGSLPSMNSDMVCQAAYTVYRMGSTASEIKLPRLEGPVAAGRGRCWVRHLRFSWGGSAGEPSSSCSASWALKFATTLATRDRSPREGELLI